ncbi:MAG: ABC transporter substrate-binding protein [Anaerolineae bacterium]
MRTLMRKFTICMLAGVLVALSGGCGIGGQPIPPTPEPIVLRFAYPGHAGEVRPLLDAFQAENPHIKVETVDLSSWGSRMGDTLTQNEIDVFRAGRAAMALGPGGTLRVFDELMLDAWTAVREDYVAGSWESLASEGQQWAVPAGLDLMVAYLNAEQITSLGLPTPEPGWSLFEMLDLANQMNYPDGLPGQDAGLFGFCTAPDNLDPIILIYLYGGRIVNDLNDPTLATLDEPQTIEAVQWYSDLFNRYQVAPKPDVVRARFSGGGLPLAIVQGGCGIWLGWFSDRPYDPQAEGAQPLMTTLPMDQVQGMGLGDIEGYYVTQASAHPQEAAQLIRFLSDRWEAALPKLPPRASLVSSDAYTAGVGEDASVVARNLPQQIIMVPYETGPALERVAGVALQAINQIVAQDLDAAAVMTEAQIQAEQLLQ